MVWATEEDEMVTVASDLQSAKAERQRGKGLRRAPEGRSVRVGAPSGLMAATPLGITTEPSDEHKRKAPMPIETTDSGIVMLLSALQPKKA